MSLTESQAQQVTLVRILEQTREVNDLWSSGDAKEATRVAMEKSDARVPFDQFLARRADLVLIEIGKRPTPAMALKEPRWPTFVGWMLVAMSMLIGFITDHLASDHRVNVVEFPLVLLIIWNLLIFLGIFVRWLTNLFSSGNQQGGFLADLVGRWHLWGGLIVSDENAQKLANHFRSEWISLSSRLNKVRLELVLHTAALSFTFGTLGSLYVRGFFKEYRASWESTFFSAESIHAIASLVLAPGAFLLNIQIPDVHHIAALRFPESSGEVASGWIHLYAASILVWIIIPRALLVLSNGFTRWHLQRSFPLPTTGTYFNALRAIRRDGKAIALAIPFRYELTPQIKSNLSKLLQGIHGLAVDISIQLPVLMGEDTSDWKSALGDEEHIAVFVIFNLTATAESDTHARLMEQVIKDVSRGTTIIPIVDTSCYVDQDLERCRQRKNQWRSVLDEVKCNPLFLDLSKPDSDDVVNALKERLNDHE